MQLVIDIGNTRSRLAVFDKCDLKEMKLVPEITEELLSQTISRFPAVRHGIISSVAGKEEHLSNHLFLNNVNTLILNDSMSLPFINNYETKKTLGNDRLAAVAGACLLYPKKNVLIFDAGTAITIDFKSADEQYRGGNISPGLAMRFKALQQNTARLPLLEPDYKFSLLGRNTRDAIVSGVQQGILFEMNGYIETFEKQYPDIVVIMTGGDAPFFDNMLKKTIFVISDLTLSGLNYILRYNVETE